MRALLVLALVAGCATTPGWNAPAGASLDEGGFGNATAANTALMTTGEATQALALRFVREVDPAVTFAFDSAALEPAAQAALARQAAWMRQFPELRFSVYGHADLVGSAAYNEALGRRRAEAVVRFLASRGISSQRLVALVSYGETRPRIPVPGPERANRRTVTEVSGFLRRHPTLLNGKYAAVVFREYVESATERPPSGSATTEAAAAE